MISVVVIYQSRLTKATEKLVLIAARVPLFPYRTQKLSSLALKILGGRLPGKISRRQHRPFTYGERFFALV